MLASRFDTLADSAQAEAAKLHEQHSGQSEASGSGAASASGSAAAMQDDDEEIRAKVDVSAFVWLDESGRTCLAIDKDDHDMADCSAASFRLTLSIG